MSRTPTDWTVWLPKAFFLDWSDQTKWEHHLSDPTIWLPMGIFPQEVREGIVNYYYYRISKTQGDTVNVGSIQGSDTIIGENIRSRTLNDSESPSSKKPNEYSKALKDISDAINEQLKYHKVPEEQIKLINNSLEELKNKIKI